MRAIDDPTQVATDPTLHGVASPGQSPIDMDASKSNAWTAIADGKPINIVVGPPGVGKTYLITHLIRSILEQAPNARILVSAQSHHTLAHLEYELRKVLPLSATIIVRIERSNPEKTDGPLRRAATDILRNLAKSNASAQTANQSQRINQALEANSESAQAIKDTILRDTEHLLLRSADVVIASTNSFTIEEMVANGDQFDWVIVEEAARANGPELIGPLILGNRRIMIGDHNQLSPFDAVMRSKLYDFGQASVLLEDAQKQLDTIPDIPKEIDNMLNILKGDTVLLEDILATAARLEEPFKTIAEREDERKDLNPDYTPAVNILLEQSRMHPAICELVSNTFYDGMLLSTERVRQRTKTVASDGPVPDTPIVVLNLPSLSKTSKEAFEEHTSPSYRNTIESEAIYQALKHIHPMPNAEGSPPSMAILSPYSGQVQHLERLLTSSIDKKTQTLFGFVSPRSDGRFFYTVDSFQGGEADLVVVSLVRNNVLVGFRSLGFLTNRQRLNVLLSRARQKLLLTTSLDFLTNAVDGTDPDRTGSDLSFIRTMVSEFQRLSATKFEGKRPGASIVDINESGGFEL